MKTFEEIVFKKIFPNEDFNADDFYDWAAENSSIAWKVMCDAGNDLLRSRNDISKDAWIDDGIVIDSIFNIGPMAEKKKNK